MHSRAVRNVFSRVKKKCLVSFCAQSFSQYQYRSSKCHVAKCRQTKVEKMTSSFSLSLLLHYLLLPIVMHAAVSDSLEQCRLCRESEETSNCLSRGIKYESELLHIRLEEEQHAFVVSLSIQKFFGDESGKKGHCFFTLRRPKGNPH